MPQIVLTNYERESSTWKKIEQALRDDLAVQQFKLMGYVEANRIHEAAITLGRIRDVEEMLEVHKVSEAPN